MWLYGKKMKEAMKAREIKIEQAKAEAKEKQSFLSTAMPV